MASTDKNEVLQMQADYLAHAITGDPAKFSIVNYTTNELIKGYVFSKSDILNLYDPSNPRPIYLMLGLTCKHAYIDVNQPYITPILGRISGVDASGVGIIDTKNLVYCDTPITQSTLMQTFLNSDYKYNIGAVIDPVEAQRMIDNFKNLPDERSLKILDGVNKKTITAYTITVADIVDILNPLNPLPMIILPALLDKTLLGVNVDPKQLTFILSNLISPNTYSFNMRDYLLPCPPSGCSSLA